MPKFLRIILSPFTIIYFLVIKIRNIFFDKNIFKTEKCSVPVISVGSLAIGGSGKTPGTIFFTNLLKKNKINVGVLSRGYRRETKGYLLVSDGKKNFTSVTESGDEIFLISEECNVPTAVAERRVEGTKKFIQDIPSLEAIVLDDAFQHRWIHRDLNILIIDQDFMFNDSKMDRYIIPLGMLREPLSAIKRADVIIINRKFSEKKEIPDWFLKYYNNDKIFYGYYEATGISDLKDKKFFKLKDFIGQKSVAVCGIARPKSFLKILNENKITPIDKVILEDHKNYTLSDINLIRHKFYKSNAYSVLTTHKDAVKLTKFTKELDDIEIYYLMMEFKIEDEKKINKLLIEKIKKQ
ncbi:MAG: tetraacyldisaccharide 4'-kinase [Ignavibacteriales bacterium]|nr:tetraacyldisaccharide 4'-kinase [Ignavibacteriales bacterium]